MRKFQIRPINKDDREWVAALRFYQKYGLSLAALHRNAIEESRRLKPEIPLTGNDGIEIRDEIELEMVL